MASLAAEEDDVANEVEEENFEAGMKQNAAEYDAADVDQDRKLDFGEFCAMVRWRASNRARAHTQADTTHGHRRSKSARSGTTRRLSCVPGSMPLTLTAQARLTLTNSSVSLCGTRSCALHGA